MGLLSSRCPISWNILVAAPARGQCTFWWKSQDTFQPNKIAPLALTSETLIVLLVTRGSTCHPISGCDEETWPDQPKCNYKDIDKESRRRERQRHEQWQIQKDNCDLGNLLIAPCQPRSGRGERSPKKHKIQDITQKNSQDDTGKRKYNYYKKHFFFRLKIELSVRQNPFSYMYLLSKKDIQIGIFWKSNEIL